MSVNQQTVEDTKAQIRGLVNEIAQLSKSGATSEEYYPELLGRILFPRTSLEKRRDTCASHML